MQLKILNSSLLSKNVIYYDTIDSTQREAWRILDEDNKENNTRKKLIAKEKSKSFGVIIADCQTSGIGTHGRNWYKENKEDITFSIFLSTYSHISKLENITIKIAEILVDIFKERYHINLEIKKPNDLILNR